MHISGIKIYSDAYHEGMWFKDLCPELLEKSEIIKIQRRGSNLKIIEEVIAYDRPDIIVTLDDVPKLVLEKTSEVPTGHNIGQRVGRIVKAAEMGIPSITFLPYDAVKHGKFSSLCNLNIRLLDAFLNISKIHQTPTISVNWKSDKNGELIRDGSQDFELSELIKNFIINKFNPKNSILHSHLAQMEKEFKSRLFKKKSYGFPPNSVEIISTNKFLDLYSPKIIGYERILGKHSTSLVYTINMKPEKSRRQDPYTGMQFVYDYQHCRTGKLPEEKKMNLILNIPLVSKRIWISNNPNDLNRKSCLWYKTANLIILKDGVIHIR